MWLLGKKPADLAGALAEMEALADEAEGILAEIRERRIDQAMQVLYGWDVHECGQKWRAVCVGLRAQLAEWEREGRLERLLTTDVARETEKTLRGEARKGRQAMREAREGLAALRMPEGVNA
jgi:hypothetical protein